MVCLLLHINNTSWNEALTSAGASIILCITEKGMEIWGHIEYRTEVGDRRWGEA